MFFKLIKLAFIILGLGFGYNYISSSVLNNDNDEDINFERVRIEDILQHPREYHDQHVTVSGTVVSSSTFIWSLFSLDDGSATINIISSKGAPKEGQRMTIRGKVNQFFKVKDKEVIIIKEI
ncbi:MAG: hypothetical protein GWN16_04085 [Calditrichae bacterium]|nr:hypothetical protein [Calditrichia bacterium]